MKPLFVSYYYLNYEDKTGYGQIIVNCSKLKTEENFNNLKNFLKKTGNCKEVAIINWRRLE